jgi:hypothetical protein
MATPVKTFLKLNYITKHFWILRKSVLGVFKPCNSLSSPDSVTSSLIQPLCSVHQQIRLLRVWEGLEMSLNSDTGVDHHRVNSVVHHRITSQILKHISDVLNCVSV